MKKFLLGYLIGSVLSSIATDYLVRTEIYFRLTDRLCKPKGWSE